MQKTLFVIAILLAVSGWVRADNQVVVIPLAEDVIIPDSISPLTRAHPSFSDYSIPIHELTVLDKITGLEWQRQDDTVTRNRNLAYLYCAELNLSGKSDWRLPSLRELQSIIDYSSPSSLAINTQVFSFTNIVTNMSYWSASYFTPDNNVGWVINFNDDGFSLIKRIPKATRARARCVRNVVTDAAALRDNGNGTVTDFTTGLEWQKQTDGISRTHATAETYCANLSLAGHTDWRLPNAKESFSIFDIREYSPAIDVNKFAFTGNNFWSATDYVANSAEAWYASVILGDISVSDKSASFQARCVRRG